MRGLRAEGSPKCEVCEPKADLVFRLFRLFNSISDPNTNSSELIKMAYLLSLKVSPGKTDTAF